MTNILRSALDSFRHPSHVFLLALVLVLSACSSQDPVSPQAEQDIDVLGPVASLPSDLEIGDFRDDEVDLSDVEYDGEDGPFQHVVRVGSGLELAFRFNGTVRAREEVSITLRASGEGRAVRGKVSIDFGDGRGIKKFEIDRTVDIDYTYREKGRYRVFALIEAEDGRTARGGFRLVVNEPVRVDLFVEALDSLRPGEEVRLQVNGQQRTSRISRKARGALTISYGDDSPAESINDFTGEAIRRHTYPEEGEYVLILLLEMNGREFTSRQTVKVEDTLPNGDELDLSQAIIMGNSAQDVASWAVTSQVTGTAISANEICIFHTRAGQWPVWEGAVEGNPWVVANINGRWYAGTYEWVRPGQVCKAITAGNIGPHIKFPPMDGWRPQQGEVVYLFMSTVSRLGATSSNERSNVVKVIWPY